MTWTPGRSQPELPGMDLAADPFYRWLNSYHWVPLTVLGLVLLAVGGWLAFRSSPEVPEVAVDDRIAEVIGDRTLLLAALSELPVD